MLEHCGLLTPVLTQSPFGIIHLSDGQNVLSNAIHASVIPHMEKERFPFVKHMHALYVQCLAQGALSHLGPSADIKVFQYTGSGMESTE